MNEQITQDDPRVRTLEARKAQLETRRAALDAVVRAGEGHDPSHGRELDDVSSLLAQVRAEIVRRRGARRRPPA
ncbi:MAG: hypothetical protein Q8K79_12415 [Solirubrobacteraceae bacterium]|nr:hypothetical protein [Solirubrobacteraceae bacterium]